MKIKYIFTGILSLLLLIAVSQVFSIPPYGGDVLPVYKSGYFRELDRGFRVITDSFLGIKTLSRPVYGWIFLEDMEKSHGFTIEVYDARGHEVTAPGIKNDTPDDDILAVLNYINPDIESSARGGTYASIIPVTAEKECLFCHRDAKRGAVIGAVRFTRGYDSHVYYASERVIIFLFFSLIIAAALYFVIRWDPERNIKELFDKT